MTFTGQEEANYQMKGMGPKYVQVPDGNLVVRTKPEKGYKQSQQTH